MNLPDTFPKQFTITVTIGMEKLLAASMTEWGKILERHLNIAEHVAVEQIRDYRIRHRCFEYYKVDVGDNFKFDYNYAWVTTDDDVIQLLRLDMLPLSRRAMDAEIAFLGGELIEYLQSDGTWVFREVKKKD